MRHTGDRAPLGTWGDRSLLVFKVVGTLRQRHSAHGAPGTPGDQSLAAVQASRHRKAWGRPGSAMGWGGQGGPGAAALHLGPGPPTGRRLLRQLPDGRALRQQERGLPGTGLRGERPRHLPPGGGAANGRHPLPPPAPPPVPAHCRSVALTI